MFFVSIVAETARKLISAARPRNRARLARVAGSDFFRTAFSIGLTGRLGQPVRVPASAGPTNGRIWLRFVGFLESSDARTTRMRCQWLRFITFTSHRTGSRRRENSSGTGVAGQRCVIQGVLSSWPDSISPMNRA